MQQDPCCKDVDTSSYLVDEDDKAAQGCLVDDDDKDDDYYFVRFLSYPWQLRGPSDHPPWRQTPKAHLLASLDSDATTYQGPRSAMVIEES